jgi:hypothetical protein
MYIQQNPYNPFQPTAIPLLNLNVSIKWREIFVASETNKKNWFWPEIVDRPSAVSASDQGFWAAVFVASITALLATISLAIKSDVASVDGWAYVDAVIFGIFAWRIKHRSKIFAIAGLGLFILEKVDQFSQQPHVAASGIFMAVCLLICFINGVRGNFAYHRLSDQSSSE